MLSRCCNSRIKSWRNEKTFWKITKIKPFINKYNWKGIYFSLKKDDWKKTEKNNVIIALNALYAKREKIYPAYVSKHNSNREKQVILFMISIGEGSEAKSEGRMALPYSKKAISVIKRNNIKK